MSTTNYQSTFILVADDCPVQEAEVPRVGPRGKTIASLQHELLAERPYEMTSDDLLSEIHAIRNGITESERPAARDAFFAKPQACLRSSPLGKRYGWDFISTTTAASLSFRWVQSVTPSSPVTRRLSRSRR